MNQFAKKDQVMAVATETRLAGIRLQPTERRVSKLKITKSTAVVIMPTTEKIMNCSSMRRLQQIGSRVVHAMPDMGGRGVGRSAEKTEAIETSDACHGRSAAPTRMAKRTWHGKEKRRHRLFVSQRLDWVHPSRSSCGVQSKNDSHQT